ncbi:hypothetical protein [Prauserella rugosa]|uniref:hypothetical protein n=1 Tax=Prauserella rugosa TaxID=43354 RepID=UPI0009FEE38D|nr:hypothetical protein [Prauserella rugosa]
MRRGRWADDPETLRAHSRLGVVRAATLQAQTVNKSTVYRRCLPGGPWRWVLPGVIVLQNSPPTADQRLVAALLYGGPHTLITGLEACRRQGLRLGDMPPDDRVHILVPHARRVRSTGYVLVERTVRMPTGRSIGEIPVAPVMRASLDAARRIRAETPVANLLFEAVQRGGCTPAALSAELDLGNSRGSAIPRQVLKKITPLRSVAELNAKQLAESCSRPPTHWNPKLYTSDGHYIATPDAWWDDVGLAWEIDSVDFHYSRDAYGRTVRRNSRYGQAGVPVVQTLPSQMSSNPVGVERELEVAYQAASERGRADVRVVPDNAGVHGQGNPAA